MLKLVKSYIYICIQTVTTSIYIYIYIYIFCQLLFTSFNIILYSTIVISFHQSPNVFNILQDN